MAIHIREVNSYTETGKDFQETLMREALSLILGENSVKEKEEKNGHAKKKEGGIKGPKSFVFTPT